MTDPNRPPSEPEPRPAFPLYPQAPPSDYTVEPQAHLPAVDPLVSPDFGGWWRRGMTIVRGGWKQLALLQAAGLLLALLFGAPIAVFAAVESERLNQIVVDPDSTAQPDLAPLFALIGLGLLGALASLLAAAVVTLASVHIGASVAIGAEPRIGDALRLGVRRLFPLIGWSLLAAPIYLAGICLCVIPVFYVAAVFIVLPVVVAVERTNAISRCFSLFHGDFGTAAARCATILGITIGASVLGGMVGSVLDLGARSATPGSAGVVAGSIASTLIAAVVSGAVAVLLAPLTLAAYADMRARRDDAHGLTIAHELGLVPAGQAPWPTNPTGYSMGS